MAGLLPPGSIYYGAFDERGRPREWDAANNRFIDDEDEGQDLGAELIDGEGYDVADGNGGSYAGLEFIGDVGRDPMSYNVND